MFILVSVVNGEALVQAFKTMEEAKEKWQASFTLWMEWKSVWRRIRQRWTKPPLGVMQMAAMYSTTGIFLKSPYSLKHCRSHKRKELLE